MARGDPPPPPARAGIYARKSTVQEDTADEHRSVARQVEHARAFADRNGWTVDPGHVYVDDGISGAEFERRPGLARLLAAIDARPRPFEALIVSERSRLGREMIETGSVLKRLALAGVAVWSYLDGQRLALDTAHDRMVASVLGIVDDLERERGRQRTHDALLQRARAGYVAGGLVFGYRNVAVSGHVERRIEDAEAAVVRRIFALAAEGYGYVRIAHRLNEEGAACPRPRRGQRPGWAASSVREVLFRELYRGFVVWNRTQRRNTWGQREARPRPEAQWVRVEAPALRIVSEALWRAAHARIDQTRAAYLRSTGGVPGGRPLSGVEGRYLLSQLAGCGACGGSLYVRAKPGAHRAAYRCIAAVTRGPRACGNRYPLPLPAADEAVLSTVRRELLRADVIEEALGRAVAEVQGRDGGAEARRAEILAALRQVDGELARLAAAIAQGGEFGSLMRAVQEREARKHR